MKPSGVEKAEKKEQNKSEKTLRVVLASMGVLIVGVIIAIVVVAMNRSNKPEEYTIPISPEYQVATTYEEISTEIGNKILEYEIADSPVAVTELYKAYADRAKDEEVKDMLMLDYYFHLIGQDHNFSQKDEIVSQLKSIDSRLQTVDSALNVMWAGYYYNDYNLMEEYKPILEERGFDGDVSYMLEKPTEANK
ncbi:MAG: hypothetical protein Q4F56_02425 [Candidatus Saccharibacteria bacterium]|nr:hypothetical protein [Candidatus Saccharibacteria bacterium]